MFSTFGQPTQSSSPSPFASNPFATTATNVSSANTNNPFGAPSKEQQQQQPVRQASPFATGSSDGEASKVPAKNPFASSFAKPSNGTGSPFGNGESQSKEVKVNPFAQNSAFSKPAQNNAFSTQTQNNGFTKPAPSFGAASGGGGGGGFGGNNNGFTTANGTRPPTGPRGGAAATAPAASSKNLNAQEATRSNDPHAKRVYEQLRKDNISPPPWPSQPGNPAKKAEVARFREQYEAYRKKVRVSLTKAGLIDDPDKRKTLENAIEFKGICEDMCPQYEQITRINESDVVSAEKDPGTSWAVPGIMVKKLARSAAGQEAPLPMDVRSVAALKRTFDYLIDDLLRDDSNLPNVHGFLWDRTRAIRRDFTFFSSLTPEELKVQVYVLENIARFHITSLHLLTQEGVKPEDFVEQQEAEQLGKALLSLRDVYDDCGEQGIVCENEAEFRAYYLIYHAKDPNIIETLQRQWNPKLWKESDAVRVAVSLVEAMQSTHDFHGPSLGLNKEGPSLAAAAQYLAYFRIVEDPKISYTMACFAEYNFPHIRKNILSAIKKALARPKDSAKDVTAQVLNRFLRFDTIQQAIDFAEIHNLEWVPDAQFPDDISKRCLVLNHRRGMAHPRLYHQFSRTLVEKKRGGNSLPTIIHQSVFEDASGVKGTSSSLAHEPSLFVPEKSTTPPPSGVVKAPAKGGIFGGGDATEKKASSFGSLSNNTPQQPQEAEKPAASNPFASFFKPAQETTTAAPTTTTTTTTVAPPTFSWNAPSTAKSEAPSAPSIGSMLEPAKTVPSLTNGASPFDTSAGASTSKPSPFASTPAPAEPAKPSEAKEPTKGLGAPAEEAPKAAPKFQFGSSPAPSDSPFNNPATMGSVSAESTGQKALPGLGATSPFQPAPATALPAANSTPQITFEPPKPAQAPLPAAPSLSTPSFPASESSRPVLPAVVAPPPPPSKPAPPPRDPMLGLTDWYLNGDEGLLSEFKAYIVEELLTTLYDDFQQQEAERILLEEEAALNAQADAFRRYNLSVRYFYRWKNTARELRLRNVRRQAREEARAFYEEQRAAERQAKKEAAALAARKEAKMRGINRPEELIGFLKNKKVGRREAERALLESGVLKGVMNEREHVERIVEREISPSVDGSVDGGRSRRSRSGSMTSSATKRGGSKTRALRDELLRGGDVNGFRRSLPSSMAVSARGRSSAEPDGGASSSSGRSKSRVSERWRLKAMGIVQMPDGTALPEGLANEYLYGGKPYPSLGASTSGASELGSSRRASFGASSRLKDSIAMPPPPRSISAQKAMAEGSASPTKRKRAEEEEEGDRDGEKEGKEARGEGGGGGGSNHKRIMSGAEKVISELRALRMEMEEGREWFREQSEVLRGSSRGSTPWGGEEGA